MRLKTTHFDEVGKELGRNLQIIAVADEDHVFRRHRHMPARKIIERSLQPVKRHK